MVSLEAIRRAAARLQGHVRRTPVLDVSEIAERPLFLKCEMLQHGGAFKIRGAMNMLLQLPRERIARGVITYSSGNHGQAVAIAAARFGVPAVVVMPTTAPAVKVEGVQRWGAEVILEGTTSADRLRRAEAEVAIRGLAMIPPFDHEWIIEGQGTCGLEILDQVPAVDTVVVPVGGGGLVAGVSAAVKQSQSRAVVIGVEPSGAAKMTASLEAGRPVTLDRAQSIADGLIPVRPGDLTLAHVREFVETMLTVDDARIAQAVRWLFAEAHLVVEPSGAASVAAVLWPDETSPLADRSRTVVAVLSGGNIAIEQLRSLEGERVRG